MLTAAGKFKAQCLAIVYNVQETHEEVTVTKRDKAVAKLVPVEDKLSTPLFSSMKGHVQIKGDIVATTGKEWNADA